MSHRALVAVATGPDRHILSVDPNGGDDATLRRLTVPGAHVSPGSTGRSIVARGLSFEAILTKHLDPVEHEALVVLGSDGLVTPHRVLPFVLATAHGIFEGDPAGATVALRGGDGATLDPAYVRGWLHGMTASLAEAVDVGLIRPQIAFEWLDDAVRRLAGGRFECHVLSTTG